MNVSVDQATADAFARSWNNLPAGSVYTFPQFEEWLRPRSAAALRGKSVLELGCGNGSLLVHLVRWRPSRVVGVDLGASVVSARENLRRTGFAGAEIVQADLQDFREGGFDFVYCIGVLHHLQDPQAGFRSVIDNVKPGGWFHCWVYGYEGNAIVRLVVEPFRRVCCRLPWWFTRYVVAAPLAAPFFFYSKFLRALPLVVSSAFPLHRYARSISQNGFRFFRHVAFDQLVSPHTAYIRKQTIEDWLKADARIVPGSIYIEQRNGNSWKFGGRVILNDDSSASGLATSRAERPGQLPAREGTLC
jgi:SAM-dependent methyltransferase